MARKTKERKFFGQNGEDCVLWSIFRKNKKDGIFLDIGSLDGMRFSNTYSFELAGWSGICAEAHPLYYKHTKKNRPNSIAVHAAISSADKANTIFYANMLGTLSTLDGSMEGYFKSAYKKAFRGYKKIKVPMRQIDTLLKEHGIKKVDVVSIDVEGTEIDVLKGFTLKVYKPKILVIEALNPPREKRLMHYMKVSGYHFARKLGNNFFFCSTKKYAEKARNAKIVPRKTLIHTDHPMKGKKK